MIDFMFLSITKGNVLISFDELFIDFVCRQGGLIKLNSNRSLLFFIDYSFN